MSGVKAKLQVGSVVEGEQGPLYVRGYLLFKEWDQEDERFYMWEEWQLQGAAGNELWLELDHYSGDVVLYEPLPLAPGLNPAIMAPGRVFELSSPTGPVSLKVKSMSQGVLVESQGQTTCSLRPGETMGYAEVKVRTADGKSFKATVDSHRLADTVVYRRRRLGAAEQKALLGQVIRRPRSGRLKVNRTGFIIVLVLFFTLHVVPALLRRLFSGPRRTPSGSSTSSGTGSGSGGTSYRPRPVYGGGGRGVGK